MKFREALLPRCDVSRRLRYFALELTLSLAVAWGLHLLALNLSHVQGLGMRYAIAPEPPWTDWWRAASPTEPATRAAWLLWAAPGALPAQVLLGWLGLCLARSGQRWAWPGVSMLAGTLIASQGWAAPEAVVQVVGAVIPAGLAWPALGFAGGVLLALLPCGPTLSGPQSAGRGGLTPDSIAQSLLWPLFAALSGMAWIAIADFAAGADPLAAHYGPRAADALLAATLTALLAAASRPAIGRIWLVSVRVIGLLGESTWGRMLFLALGLSAALLLGWLGRPNYLGALPVLGKGLGLSHVSGEILRLAACLALSWICYRAGEWGMSQARIGRILRACIAVFGLVLTGLALSSDSGPSLILALLSALLLAIAPLKHLMTRRRRWLALPLATCLVLMALGGWRFALNDIAPEISERAEWRKSLQEHPEFAREDDLMRIHWLMAAAPLTGFGAGEAPWCGASAQIGERPCLARRASLKDGAPLQTPEDFALALWVARYGPLLGLLAVLAVVGWLLALIVTAMPKQWPRPGDFGAPQMRAYALFWAIAVSALALLAQIVPATGGTLGWVAMSGVPLPLMAFGKTSLCLAAFWLGLAQGPD